MFFKEALESSAQFFKFALKISPWRNVEHDLEESIDHLSDFVRLKNGQDVTDFLSKDSFDLEFIENFETEDLYRYDDISSWLEVEPNEIKNMSKNDRIIFLKQLRGSYAKNWINDGIPAIILIDLPEFKAIGDGRGRTNFAIGMGYKTVPVVIAKLKSEFEDEIKYS